MGDCADDAVTGKATLKQKFICFVVVRRRNLRVSEVASAAHVSVQTLRYYERRGLFRIVPQRSASGYREYDSDAVQRVRFIRKAQDVGFTLDEIRELLELRDRRPSPEEVRKIALAKVEDLNDRLQYLTGIRDCSSA